MLNEHFLLITFLHEISKFPYSYIFTINELPNFEIRKNALLL